MRIFLSYRREDASGHAGRLYDALAAKFGDENVFIDVDTIDPGVDFGEAITRAVAGCDALIALIGREWLNATDEEGRRRLDDPEDFVRLELEAALERDVVVIPAYVQEAEPPRADQLPAELEPLARRQGAVLRDVGWRDDVRRLISRLEDSEKTQREPAWWRSRKLLAIAVALGTVVLAAAAVSMFMSGGSSGKGEDTGSFSADERRLLGVIPAGTRASCMRRSELAPGAQASVSCSGTRLSVEYHLFPSASEVDDWYAQRRELERIEPDTGSCTADAFRGEIRWRADGREVGRVACYIDPNGESELVWTDPRVNVGAEASVYSGTGRAAVISLLRQWRCCFLLEPAN